MSQAYRDAGTAHHPLESLIRQVYYYRFNGFQKCQKGKPLKRFTAARSNHYLLNSRSGLINTVALAR